MPTETFTIADLARLSGLNVRTIRYYLAQGLLPASGESGPGAHYGEGHLDRLRLTKRLQAQHLPLSEIRQRLAELTDNDVAGVVGASDQVPTRATTSALEYVRSVLGGSVAERTTEPSAPSVTLLVPAASPAVRSRARSVRMSMESASAPMAAAPSMPAPMADAAASSQQAGPERSQWDRLELAPNIELHVRRPLSRLEQKRVERLITIARQVLKEDSK